MAKSTSSLVIIPSNKIQPPFSSGGHSGGGWGSLPDELLGLILDKLLLSNNNKSLYDYIRCATVCKSWFSYAAKYYDRMINKKQHHLPFLLIPTVDGSRTHRSLYNIIINSRYSSSGLISVPYCKRCCGSSHGWLIFAQETLALTLFNPFTGATIHLPPLLTQKQIDAIKADHEFYHEYEIKKVVISDDPSTNNNYYEVLALQFEGRLALYTSSNRRWIYAQNYFDSDLGYAMISNDDIIYFKGKFHALIGGKLGSIEIIYNSNNIQDQDDGVASYIIRLEALKGVDEIINVMSWGQSYLAESISGTLLYVERHTIGLGPPDLIDDDDEEEEGDQEPFWKRLFGYFEIDNKIYEYRRTDYLLTLCYRVYELEEEEEATDEDGIKKFKLLTNNRGEGRGLGDQALFLGYNQPVSVRASDFPGCKPNSIYFTDDYCLGEPYKELGPIDLGVYTLGDEHAKPLYMLDPSHTHLPPPIWIVPQPKFR